MVVHILRGAGLDPAYAVGGELSSTGLNADWGEGEWIVIEADESDRSLLNYTPEIAILTNSELDHHATYRSRLELDATFEEFLGRARVAVVWDRPELTALASGAGELIAYDAREPLLTPAGARFRWREFEVQLSVPGMHNAVNAAGALSACVAAGAEPAVAVAAIRSFDGARRRMQRLGRTSSGATVYDDYAHHPMKVRAALAAARTLAPRRLVVVFQPHLFSRTRALAGDFGRALSQADICCVVDIYPARERAEGLPGRRRAPCRCRHRRRARRRPGRLDAIVTRRSSVVGDDPARRRPLRCHGGPAMSTRSVSRWSLPPPDRGSGPRAPTGRQRGSRPGHPEPGLPSAAMVEPPPGVQRDFPLARLTTIRTGGPAEFFARPGSISELERLLAWASEFELEVGVVGSGSNLLVADAGVPGLVLKLTDELTTIELDGIAADRILCGAGARLPAVSAAAARAGLSGIEFGVNIPGTVGGAVRMNANAYGGVLADVLEWVDVVSSKGIERRTPDRLGFAYRQSNLVRGEIVARARFQLNPADQAQVKAKLADLRARRKDAQPSGIKTFGSTFKNPDDPFAQGRTAGQMLDEAGCRSLRVGGAGFSAKHANFVENFGEASTADVVALMDAGPPSRPAALRGDARA